jgi:aspartate ammonia-lyase
VAGIGVDRAACAAHVRASWATVTALLPSLGYDRATALAKRARETGRPVAELAVEDGLLDAETVTALLSPEAMTALGYRG